MAEQKTMNVRGVWDFAVRGPGWNGQWELSCETERTLVKIHGHIGNLHELARAVREMADQYQKKMASIEKVLKGDG